MRGGAGKESEELIRGGGGKAGRVTREVKEGGGIRGGREGDEG